MGYSREEVVELMESFDEDLLLTTLNTPAARLYVYHLCEQLSRPATQRSQTPEGGTNATPVP